jgi:hypothetical protein
LNITKGTFKGTELSLLHPEYIENAISSISRIRIGVSEDRELLTTDWDSHRCPCKVFETVFAPTSDW